MILIKQLLIVRGWTMLIRDENDWLYKNPDNPYALPISILPEGGIYQRQDRKMLGLDFRGTVSWNHLFAEKHITNLFCRNGSK